MTNLPLIHHDHPRQHLTASGRLVDRFCADRLGDSLSRQRGEWVAGDLDAGGGRGDLLGGLAGWDFVGWVNGGKRGELSTSNFEH